MQIINCLCDARRGNQHYVNEAIACLNKVFTYLPAYLPTRWGKFGRVFCKQTSVAACRFQNECNKVEIALCVVQFWFEIKLVITNRTPALRSWDFLITRLISDQIALHSVQLP